jgi:AcrR family transcriptional regulator
MAVTDDRPLRADARRNRDAIVKAARVVFAREGRGAQMDDVARRAKVGVGTLYRHFPTKQVLLKALAQDRFSQFADYAREALEIEDPWEGYATFMRRAAALQASDLALSQMLGDEPGVMGAAAAAQGDLLEATDTLVARAKEAGAMRADARAADIGMIMCALSRAGAPVQASWERMLEIILDGLRAEARRGELPD